MVYWMDEQQNSYSHQHFFFAAFFYRFQADWRVYEESNRTLKKEIKVDEEWTRSSRAIEYIREKNYNNKLVKFIAPFYNIHFT